MLSWNVGQSVHHKGTEYLRIEPKYQNGDLYYHFHMKAIEVFPTPLLGRANCWSCGR